MMILFEIMKRERDRERCRPRLTNLLFHFHWPPDAVDVVLQPSFQRKQQQFNGSSTSPTPYSNYTSANSTLNRQGSNHGGNPGNMSELDNLLQDLKSTKYGQSLERRHNGEKYKCLCCTRYLSTFQLLSADNGRVSTPTGGRPLNDSIARPSVDSLLDELSNAHNNQPIYATING